jgi:hypothetical protein
LCGYGFGETEKVRRGKNAETRPAKSQETPFGHIPGIGHALTSPSASRTERQEMIGDVVTQRRLLRRGQTLTDKVSIDKKPSLGKVPSVSAFSTYLCNLQQNDFNNVYPAKTSS